MLRATEPPTSSAIASFRPNDAALFSAFAPSFASCPARAPSSRSGSTDLSHSSDFEQIDRPGPGQRDRFLSGSIASARSVASVRSGLNWCLRTALRLRGGSAGRPNRWIGPALTAPSLEDGTGRGPALVPALEQNPAGAEGIVGVPQNLDDAAKRPTPLSELRHLRGLRRTLPLHLAHLSFQRNAEPADSARPGPTRACAAESSSSASAASRHRLVPSC